MQSYFKNNFISIYYNEDKRLGKAVWKGRLQGEELREAFLLCLELVNRFALTRWLADDRQMGSITPADLRWNLEVCVPQLATGPLLRMARLPSHSEENRGAVELMISKGQDHRPNLVLRDFTDEQEAMDWLMEPL